MRDSALLVSIAQQMMTSNTVGVNRKHVPVCRTSSHRLRTVAFNTGLSSHRTESRETEPLWQLAREGHQVVQFKDMGTNRRGR
jgi:hypothetical protein